MTLKCNVTVSLECYLTMKIHFQASFQFSFESLNVGIVAGLKLSIANDSFSKCVISRFILSFAILKRSLDNGAGCFLPSSTTPMPAPDNSKCNFPSPSCWSRMSSICDIMFNPSCRSSSEKALI